MAEFNKETLMSTPDSQVHAVKDMCDKLEKDDSAAIRSAHVDDWGRFGNFAVHVVPAAHTRSTTARLKACIRKALPAGAMLRECFPPEPEYRRDGTGKRVLSGYSRNYWVFDIDFRQYDRDTNRFS